jgi:N-acetylmuramoyl-L-alanine amidase
MGGDYWDERTGKYVHDKKGRKLSEGVLALQISMLLEKSLTALGAQVKITRYSLAPVTTLSYENFDLRERALLAVREDSLSPWFQALLSTSSPGPKLFRAFEGSSRFKNLFSNSQRWDYFIEGYDLDARIDSINEFKPDLTLIIHLDAGNIGPDSNGVNPKPYDGTKVYVPGAFFSNEFTSRDDRKFFGRHLLSATSWNDSVDLARSLAHHLHDGLGIGYDRTDTKNTVEIEPGVMARNLRVQRRLTSQATAYVECLYYNDPREFEALLKTTHSMMIDGKEMPYSDRLEQIATSLRDGILAFTRSYQ